MSTLLRLGQEHVSRLSSTKETLTSSDLGVGALLGVTGMDEAHSTKTKAAGIVKAITNKLPIDNRPSQAVQIAMIWLRRESAGKKLPYAAEGIPSRATKEVAVLLLGDAQIRRSACRAVNVRGERDIPCRNLSKDPGPWLVLLLSMSILNIFLVSDVFLEADSTADDCRWMAWPLAALFIEGTLAVIAVVGLVFALLDEGELIVVLSDCKYSMMPVFSEARLYWYTLHYYSGV